MYSFRFFFTWKFSFMYNNNVFFIALNTNKFLIKRKTAKKEEKKREKGR